MAAIQENIFIIFQQVREYLEFLICKQACGDKSDIRKDNFLIMGQLYMIINQEDFI